VKKQMNKNAIMGLAIGAIVLAIGGLVFFLSRTTEAPAGEGEKPGGPPKEAMQEYRKQQQGAKSGGNGGYQRSQQR
jgi:hypothetical protein